MLNQYENDKLAKAIIAAEILLTLAAGILIIALAIKSATEKIQNPPEKIERYGQTYVLQTEAPPATTEINGHTYVLQK